MVGDGNDYLEGKLKLPVGDEIGCLETVTHEQSEATIGGQWCLSGTVEGAD